MSGLSVLTSTLITAALGTTGLLQAAPPPPRDRSPVSLAAQATASPTAAPAVEETTETAPAAAVPATAATADGRLSWPLSPVPTVIRKFVLGPDPWSPGHRGIDLQASPGQSVLAAAAGIVVFAGQVAGRGTVSVRHDNGVRTTYQPVLPAVSTGARVRAGQVLGTVLPGHRSDVVSLHWGALLGSQYLDPLLLLDRPPATRPILLPWRDPAEDP